MGRLRIGGCIHCGGTQTLVQEVDSRRVGARFVRDTAWRCINCSREVPARPVLVQRARVRRAS